MNTLVTKQTEMCIRVIENRQQFVLAEAEGLDGTGLFDDLVLAVEQVRSGAHDQSRADSSMRDNSSDVEEKRAELLRQMSAIRRTARATGLPGMENKFLSPDDLPDQKLLTLARTYGTDAFQIKADLIKKGLGVDLVNDLAEAAQKFDGALKEREEELGNRMEATGEIRGKIEEAVRIVHGLGVTIRNVYAKDPAKLALWESVSHVEKVARRSRPTDDDDNAPPPPAQG